MNMNFKMFCILFFGLLYATQVKRQKIWPLFWKKVSFCRVFCCHYYLLSGCQEDQRLCGTNYIRFISFYVSEEISVTFDPEVDLNDDAVGRSLYERFYSVGSNYLRENLSHPRRSREPSRVGCLRRTFACEAEATINSRTHLKEYPEVFQNS